jgi:serine/threonine protein kinase
MLTRIPPFTATNEMDLLIKVRDAKYRPVGELTPGIPHELEQITDKCLTRSRANRYQTAAEAEGDLRTFLRKFMPNYSRSHLGRFIRKMFAQEIERELRMLEEFVMTDEPSDDVGESLMVRDEDFEPPEVPFQPKPTSVSIIAAREALGMRESRGMSAVGPLPTDDFSGDSNFTTMPKAPVHDEHDEDIHGAHTRILEPGRGRSAQRPAQEPEPAPAPRRRTQPPPPPSPPAAGVRPIYDEDLHSAPTMIIDIGRMRNRRSGGQ